MKKGFTLIELLAVIVILAIIALIATPIVLNIINDTKESAQLRSAEMYLDGVEQAIMRENMKGTFNPNICNLKDGSLSCDDKPVMVDVKGEKPTDGTITFQNGKINEVSLSFEPNKTIIKNEEGKLVYAVLEEKICKAITPIEQLLQGDCESCTERKVVGVQATEDDPYALGAVYSCDLGDSEERIFYVLKNDTTNNQVSLIMDENLGDPVVWATSGYNTDGPVTANAALIERTSGWTKLVKVGGMVKLPSSDMLDSQEWLRTNLLFVEAPTSYWTSTAFDDEYDHYAYVYDCCYGTKARCGVDGEGDYDSTATCHGSGIRPVITIPKDSLSLE